MLLSAICVAALAVVHLGADRLRISVEPARSAWLSAASGSSVAFVFVLLMPEVAERQQAVDEIAFLEFIDHHVWFVALFGLVTFFWVEHWIMTHAEGRGEATHAAFWGHVGIFALYNVVIGYLLFDPQPALEDRIIPYAIALAFHLLVIDESMRRHHPVRYHRIGRWVLAAGVLTGGAIGAAVELHEAVPALALALLAGGIALNALKEELPEERDARMWPFAAGAVGFALLALVTTGL